MVIHVVDRTFQGRARLFRAVFPFSQPATIIQASSEVPKTAPARDQLLDLLVVDCRSPGTSLRQSIHLALPNRRWQFWMWISMPDKKPPAARRRATCQ